MSLPLRQWDVVKVRINPGDRDEHPALIISADEVCASAPRVNVLYGSTHRPGQPVRPPPLSAPTPISARPASGACEVVTRRPWSPVWLEPLHAKSR